MFLVIRRKSTEKKFGNFLNRSKNGTDYRLIKTKSVLSTILRKISGNRMVRELERK